jgi:hypothetical protein
MVESTNTSSVVGFSKGNVMLKNCRQLLAPSIFAMLSPFVKTNLKDFLGGFAHPVVSMRQSVMSVA